MEITDAALHEFCKDFMECVVALEEKYGVTAEQLQRTMPDLM